MKKLSFLSDLALSKTRKTLEKNRYLVTLSVLLFQLMIIILFPAQANASTGVRCFLTFNDYACFASRNPGATPGHITVIRSTDGVWSNPNNIGCGWADVTGNVTNMVINCGTTGGYFFIVFNNNNYMQATGVTTSPVDFYTSTPYVSGTGSFYVTASCTMPPPPDITPPVIQSAITNNSGTQITLSYSENISSSYPWIPDFTVNVNNVVRTVSNVSYSGTTCLLTVNPTINQGQTVTLSLDNSYPQIIDNSNNAAASLTNYSVTNNSTFSVSTSTITFNTDGGSVIAPLTQDEGTPVTPPAAPTKAGYTFMGWSPALPATMPVADLTCVAQWQQNTSTITFNSDGGTAVAPITGNIGDPVTPPADPTRNGYTFNGWSPAIPATFPASDLTVTASWTWNEYSVWYYSEGSVFWTYSPLHVGDPVPLPPANPVRAGYTFTGWDPAVPPTYVTSFNTTVAQWQAIPNPTSTISFDVAGGTPPIAPITQDEGTAVTAPADPTKTGYTFQGWVPTVPATMPVDDVTCVAQWEAIPPETSTITFDVAGGTPIAPITQDEGTTVIPPADPTKAGYTFMGWSPVVPSTMPVADLTCVAQWQAIPNCIPGEIWTVQTALLNHWYSVTYGDDLFVAVTQNGTDKVMTSPDGITWTARTAANNNAWLSVTYGNGLFVAVAQSGTNRVMTSADGINWTARPAPVSFWRSVTYGNGLFVAVAEDGTNRVMTSPDGIIWTAQNAAEANAWYSVTYGNSLFVAVAASGTNRVMTSPDGIIWTSRTAPEANVWLSVTYGNNLFVAVALNGTNQVITSPDGITWTARTAAEANSWNSVTYGNGFFVAVASTGTNRVMTSPDGITWTARTAAANSWKSVTYGKGSFVSVAHSQTTNSVMTSICSTPTSTITFNTDGGSAIAPITQAEGSTLIPPADPTKAGYTFMGWNPTIPLTMPVADLTCVAQWQAIPNPTSTITFDVAGGTPIAPITQDEGTTVTAPADPTKTGYTFAGWVPAVPATMPVDDITCVAQWTINAASPQYYNYNTNGSNNSFPFGISSGKEVQLLYLPGDFTQPTAAPTGYISVLYFRIADTYPINSWTYSDLTIKMGQSTITSFDAGTFYTGTLTTVYYKAAVTLTATGGSWLSITLDTPFAYDHTKSLIVDFGHCGSLGATGFSSCFTTLTNLTDKRRNWSVGGCAYSYSGQNNIVYHIGFDIGGTITPQSTITFDVAGGTPAIASITQDEGTTVTAPADPTKSGYTFMGWSPTIPATMPVNDVTCVAQWQQNTSTITFNSDGGTVVAPITGNIGDPVTPPADPTKNGYTFNGWSPAIPATFPASDLTVTASWTWNEYSVWYYSEGSVFWTYSPLHVGDPVPLPPANPVRAGYTFTGWDPAVPPTYVTSFNTTVAQWQAIPNPTSTISFDLAGGTPSIAPITQDEGTSVTAPADPTKTGYTFAGWVPAVPATMPVDDITCVAQWIVVSTCTKPELMYYKFNATGNQTNYASSPVGNNPAVLDGQTIGSTGQFGTALIGNEGVSNANRLNTGWATNLPNTGWTISFWLNNFPATSPTTRYYFGDVTAGSFRCFTGGVAPVGGMILRGNGFTDVPINAIPSTPTVIHLVYTGSAVKIYFNGIYNSQVAQSSLTFSGVGPFLVGGYSNSTSINAGTLMDEFRLYNRALDATEITATWNIELPCGSTPPTAQSTMALQVHKAGI